MNTSLPIAFLAAVATLTGGCGPPSPTSRLGSGVDIAGDAMPALHSMTVKAIHGAPPRTNWTGGLVGAMGGARVKLASAGTHELIKVLPQLTPAQIPLLYTVVIQPPEVVRDLQLRERPGTVTNVVVHLRLDGDRGQDVEIRWSAVLLVQARRGPPAGTVEAYRQETACAQASADAVTALADALWPEDATRRSFAMNIQAHIRSMEQHRPPRSMDAVGILESGGNWICTANANLAAALFRARGIPARSLAVIPPTGQRLEMHRIVEYVDDDLWRRFDPSSIHTNVPMSPWQTIVMAITTPGDEDLAMRPRMGSGLGVPYGQELEFVAGRLTFTGQDFFWTMARPLAGFEVDRATRALARRQWNRFLDSGRLTTGQCQAAAATNRTQFRAALGLAP